MLISVCIIKAIYKSQSLIFVSTCYCQSYNLDILLMYNKISLWLLLVSSDFEYFLCAHLPFVWWWFSYSVMSDSLWPHAGFSVHGILQTRILEWVATSFSRGSSWPRDRTQVSCIAGRFVTNWGTREALPFVYPLL